MRLLGKAGIGLHSSLIRARESSHVQGCPERKPASFCSDNVLQLCVFFIFFQQDNAPCYTARSIEVRMEDHPIKTLSWPAQSPDLNPIENPWNVIKRKMDGQASIQPSCLNVCARSGINSTNSNVTDWWRINQDA